MICQNCGEQTVQHSTTCAVCSQPLANKEDELIECSQDQQLFSKRQKIKLAITLGTILCLAALYFGLAHYYRIDAQVDRYMQLLERGDAEELADVLDTVNPDFTINKANISPLLQLAEEAHYINELAARLKHGKDGFDQQYELYLLQSGRFFGLFNRYQLMVTPIYLEVNSDANGAFLFVNGESYNQYQTEHQISIGPVAPGVHLFEVQMDQSGAFYNQEQLTLLGQGGQLVHVFVPIDGIMIRVRSNVESAEVYLNDDHIGQLTDYEGEFGPFDYQEGSELSLRKVFPSGSHVSDVVPVSEGSMDYMFDLAQVFDSDIEHFVQAFYFNLEAFSREPSEANAAQIEAALFNGKDNSLYQELYEQAASSDPNLKGLYLRSNVEMIEWVDVNTYQVDYQLTREEIFDHNSGKSDIVDVMTVSGLINYNPDTEQIKLQAIKEIGD
ncbi:Uncharacterized membrane protein YvbJ [Amphibacillus marinus]|uniref:Uncharacterized membrane protein YvbJ n=1 Tax=Amphibacillus marinus TaxID=872970 RepID=A0A1H8N904_9BACI|nr:hypothetical protein [Amphibacillus marinus]SEO26047.1 Uncharacterized membrane protein YvbJ [Amphibacillus marinus]